MNHFISISRLKRSFGRFRLLLFIILISCGLFYFGYWLGGESIATKKALLASQQQRLDSLYQLTDEQSQQIHFLKVEMEVNKRSNEHVQAELKALHQENFKLQKDLAFYQKVMAPELKADGVEIDEFNIVPSGSERVYHYKLVLVQTQKLKRFAKGHVKLTIKGSMDDRSRSYPMEQLIENFDNKMWQFSFRYFKILEGDLTLPEGFSPQRVQVSVVLPPGKWQKGERLDRLFRFFPEQAF